MAQQILCRLLGERLRNLRRARDLVLKDVERLSGISATHISEIERGRTSPTLQVLARIARALGTSPSYLLEVPPVDILRVTPASERRILESENGRVRLERLTEPWSASQLVVYRVRVEPGGVFSGEPPPTEDLVFVQEGAVGVRMGEQWRHLRQGDALQCCSREVVQVANGNARGAEFFWATRPGCHV